MFKPFLTKWPFLFKFRLFLASILLILVGVVLYFKIVPFGHISYSHSWPAGLRSGRGFIYDFKPGERISIDDSGSLKMSADPIYFSLFTPRAFDQAKITIKYRDRLSSSTPIIEIGVLRDKTTGRYELKPLDNKILDSLLNNWQKLINNDGSLVLMSGQAYYDVQKFWSDFYSGRLVGCNGQVADCVATYNYNLNQFSATNLSDFSEPVQPLVITQPWRGTHDFYVYLKGGAWRFDFNFVDLNQDKSADPITLRLYSGKDIVAEKTSWDDNPFPTSGQTEEKELSLQGDYLDPGLYKVSIGISDDMVISKISSPSDRLSFINKIWPVSGPGGLSLFTDIKNLQAKTFNPASLGEIDFGGQKFLLDQAYQPFIFQSAHGPKNIKLKSNDIVLEGNGVFALSRQTLVNPNLTRLDQYFKPLEPVKYILTNYRPPLVEADIKIAEVEFELKNSPRSEGRYSFILSVPGLLDKSVPSSYIEIKEIRVELNGKSLWQKISEAILR